METKLLGFTLEDLGSASKELEGMGGSDVLERPQFGEEESDACTPELKLIEQSIVLARCAQPPNLAFTLFLLH